MPRLTWGSESDKVCETGIDRGVLYLAGVAGVPWNGLTSVNEKASGGDIKQYYIDGDVYLALPSKESYEATIAAINYPQLFVECDGTVQGAPGLFVTNQRRSPFGLSYRSTVYGGDGVLGYRIHIIFNALAKPSSKVNATIGNSIRPVNYSWDIIAKPEGVTSYRSSAHFVVDSRYAPAVRFSEIEDILYGSNATIARMPTVEELFYILSNPVLLTVTDNGDGSYTIDGPRENLSDTDGMFELTWDTVTIIDADSFSVSSSV